MTPKEDMRVQMALDNLDSLFRSLRRCERWCIAANVLCVLLFLVNLVILLWHVAQ